MNNSSSSSFYSNAFGYVVPEDPQQDIIGILPDPTKQEKDYLMVWKNDADGDASTHDFATDGRDLGEIGAKTSMRVGGYVKVGDSTSRLDEPDVLGQTIFCTGDQKQSRVHAGNFPVIRAIEDVNSRKGYSTKFRNKIAIFANNTGDIMPHTTSEDPEFDPEDPDHEDNDPDKQDPTAPEEEELFPPAELESPLEIENPNPDKPALKVCQNSPEPTTVQLCNEDPSGPTQIQFGHPPAEDPSAPGTLTPSPPAIVQKPDGTIEIVPAGPAGVPVPPVVAPVVPPAIVIPPVPPVVGVPPAVVVVPPVVIPPGVVVPAVTITPGAAPIPGGLTSEPGGPGEPGTVKIGDLPIVTWKPGDSGDEPSMEAMTVEDPDDDETEEATVETTDPDQETQELITFTPMMFTPGTGQPSVGTPDPAKPVTITTKEVIVGDPANPSDPTTFTFVSHCTKKASLIWNCDTGTMQLVITDPSGPSTTVVQEWTEAGVIINVLNTFNNLNADCLTLAGKLTNPGTTPSQTIWLNSSDLTRPLYGTESLAFLSDIAGLGLTTDTSPVANNLVVYADALGNRKTADTDVTCQQRVICNQTSSSVGGLRVRPNSDTAGVNLLLNTSSDVGGLFSTEFQAAQGSTRRKTSGTCP